MKKRRDVRLLVAALVLLVAGALWVIWSSRRDVERREATLAGVPKFPEPGQLPHRGAPPPMLKQAAAAPPPPQRQPAAKHDSMMSFVQAPGASVALVHVNALFNTPVFDRLRQCLPKEFGFLDKQGKQIGVDVSQDVDQVAVAPGGMAITGFFEGKPVAEKMIGSVATSEQYQGATIFTGPKGACAAQQGNLVVVSQEGDCRGLLDRARAPTPEDSASQVYGDVYMRTDLAALRRPDAPPEVRTLADGLSGLTLRANVWDSIAVSMEGQPVSGKDASDLASIARGGLGLVKGQLDDRQVELQALAELASVNTEHGKLELNLALPVNDLFDKLHFPCPGMADAGVPR